MPPHEVQSKEVINNFFPAYLLVGVPGTFLETPDPFADGRNCPHCLVPGTGGNLGDATYWPLRNIASARFRPSAFILAETCHLVIVFKIS
jgi:hypothetical protein